MTPATSKQKSFIRDLYRDIGQSSEVDIESLTKRQASELISQLLEIKKNLEPKEDDCYWYD